MLRQQILKKIVSVSTLLAAIFSTGNAAAQLTLVSFGGAYQEAQSQTIWQPSAKVVGLNFKEETWTNISDLRLKVKAGSVTWDVITSGAGGAARAASEGLLEPLDYKQIDVSNFIPGMYTDHCVGTDVFSTVIAWNTKTYGEKGPQTWADFWDVKKFPGKRSYRKGVAGMLEPALMADGVPPNKVYEVLSAPGGIERAIKKIKELKPHIAVWWASGAQHAQLMKDGEVDMVIGWNGRFDAVAKDGGKVAFTFNQALWDFECFAIPKGAPNKALAMKFLAEATKPQYQAEFTKRIPYGPTNKKAYDQISAAVARTLPSSPENVGKQLQIDPNWYIKFEARASELYQNMLTE